MLLRDLKCCETGTLDERVCAACEAAKEEDPELKEMEAACDRQFDKLVEALKPVLGDEAKRLVDDFDSAKNAVSSIEADAQYMIGRQDGACQLMELLRPMFNGCGE